MYANNKEAKESNIIGNYLNVSSFINKNSSTSILYTDGSNDRNDSNNRQNNSSLSNAPSTGNYCDNPITDGFKTINLQNNSSKNQPINSKTSKFDSKFQVNNFNLSFSNKNKHNEDIKKTTDGIVKIDKRFQTPLTGGSKFIRQASSNIGQYQAKQVLK